MYKVLGVMMGMFDRFKSKKVEKEVNKSASNLNKATATGQIKKIDAAVEKSEKTTSKFEQRTQTKFDKQSGKLNKQFDRSEAATKVFLVKKNEAPHANQVEQLLKQTQQKIADRQIKAMPSVPTHTPIVGPPPVRPRDFPAVPTAPVITKEAQQLMDEFDSDPSPPLAKKAVIDELDKWEEEMDEQIKAEEAQALHDLEKEMNEQYAAEAEAENTAQKPSKP